MEKISEDFFKNKMFTRIGVSNLWKIALSAPAKGSHLVVNIHGGMWCEYWESEECISSVGMGVYNEKEITELLLMIIK